MVGRAGADAAEVRPVVGRAGADAAEVRPTVAVHALGCKANQEEMECLLSCLVASGYRVVPFGRPADWVVVNTCTVTGTADSDSRQAVRRAARTKGRGRLLVTGCLAQRSPVDLARIEGVDQVLGNREKSGLAGYLVSERAGPGEVCGISVSRDPSGAGFVPFGTGRSGRRTRALLKIQDGCDHGCAFCVIPGVRGRSRSRPLEDAVDQAGRLVSAGFREIALTGINTALWGNDLAGELELPDLLDALAEVPGLGRIRLNSLEPQYLRAEWLDRLARNPRLCPHFHIALQSGHPAVLSRMNRSYSPEQYADLVRGLEARLPGAAIGADVLVGFPGEGEAEFEFTRRLLDSLPLAYLHVFRFSPRPGTPAAEMDGQVPAETARARAAALRELGARRRARFSRQQIGTEETLIPERRLENGRWTGLTGNYLRVELAAPDGEDLAGRMVRARLVSVDQEGRIAACMISEISPAVTSPRPVDPA